MTTREADALLAVTEQEAKQWLVATAGEVADVVAGSTRPSSSVAETADVVDAPTLSKIEALKAMRQYQAARAAGLATRSQNPAYRTRGTWLHHLSVAEAEANTISPEEEVGKVLTLFSEDPSSTSPLTAVDSLNQALTGYANYERYRGHRQDLVPPFVQGLSKAVEEAVSTLLGNDTPAVSAPRISIEDLQLAVMWSDFDNESSRQGPSPLVVSLLETASEVSSTPTLEAVATILFPRLARLLGVDTPSTGSYPALLKAFSQVVAESNATNKDLGEVATIAAAIDRICKFVIRVASTNTKAVITQLINGGPDGDVSQQDALLQIIAASAYTSFQPASSPASHPASTDINSDDEAEEVQLRDAIMQMLPGSDDTTTTDSLLKGVIRTAFRQEWERLGKQAGDSTSITTPPPKLLLVFNKFSD